ncbi:hypothetical protein ACHAXS_003066 [Conticribra weissflogii]
MKKILPILKHAMTARAPPSRSATALLLCVTAVQRMDRAAGIFEVRQVPPRLPRKSHPDDLDVDSLRGFPPVVHKIVDDDSTNESPSELPSFAPSSHPAKSSPTRAPSSRPESRDGEEDPSRELCVSIVAIAGTPDLTHLYGGSEGEFIAEQEQLANATTNTVHSNLRQSRRQRQMHRTREHSATIEERSNVMYSEKEQFACELSNGEFVPVAGSPSRMNLLRQLLNNGRLISSKTTIEGMTLTDSAYFEYDPMTKSFGIPEKEAVLPESDWVLKPTSFDGVDDATTRRARGRNLAKYEGVKRVLVVRVIDSEGRAHVDSAQVMSDKIFGTAGDQENMVQQFHDCSFGKLTLTYEPTTTSTNIISSHLAAPGVIEATIPVSLVNSTRAVIRNQVTQVVEHKLGLRLAEHFDHVMYILQKCYVQCGWGAYAYVNSWNSVYQGNYYRFPGVQLHEIGHNMNLGHSGGLDGKKTYGDHTCLMGNPLYSDTKSRMCYNPAKNFQFASGGNWYDPKFITNFDIAKKQRNKVLRRKLVGIADYDNNPDGHPVVIKLETDTDEDYFLGFNRAYGVNSDNKQADNLVTLIKAGNNGLSYSQSWLIATLGQGQSYNFRRWKGTRRRDLIITVNEIDVANSNPGYADVTLKYIRSSKKKNNPQPKPSPSSTASSPSISAPSAPSREDPDGRRPNLAPTPR